MKGQTNVPLSHFALGLSIQKKNGESRGVDGARFDLQTERNQFQGTGSSDTGKGKAKLQYKIV